jgi:hypothetical protein
LVLAETRSAGGTQRLKFEVEWPALILHLSELAMNKHVCLLIAVVAAASSATVVLGDESLAGSRPNIIHEQRFFEASGR